MSKHMEGKGLIQVVLSTLHPSFGGTLEHLMGEQLETPNPKPGAWQLELRRRADRRLKFREPFVVSEGNRSGLKRSYPRIPLVWQCKVSKCVL